PLDTLRHHKKIRDDGFEINVVPTMQLDQPMAAENVEILNGWIDRLAEIANVDVSSFDSYIATLRKRHDVFHEAGCRLSDCGLITVCAEYCTDHEIKSIFNKIRSRNALSPDEQFKFKSAMLIEFALMDDEKGWVQQLHLG